MVVQNFFKNSSNLRNFLVSFASIYIEGENLGRKIRVKNLGVKSGNV